MNDLFDSPRHAWTVPRKTVLVWGNWLDEFDICHMLSQKNRLLILPQVGTGISVAKKSVPRMCKEQLFLDCLGIRCRWRNDAVLFRPLNHKIEYQKLQMCKRLTIWEFVWTKSSNKHQQSTRTTRTKRRRNMMILIIRRTTKNNGNINRNSNKKEQQEH